MQMIARNKSRYVAGIAEPVGIAREYRLLEREDRASGSRQDVMFLAKNSSRNPLFVNFSLQRSKNKTILCGFHGPMTTFFNKRIESMRKGTSKAGGNKSQLIRDFAAANPTMKVSDIVKTLTEQGHKVYPAIVSQALRGSAGAKKPKARTTTSAVRGHLRDSATRAEAISLILGR